MLPSWQIEATVMSSLFTSEAYNWLYDSYFDDLQDLPFWYLFLWHPQCGRCYPHGEWRLLLWRLCLRQKYYCDIHSKTPIPSVTVQLNDWWNRSFAVYEAYKASQRNLSLCILSLCRDLLRLCCSSFLQMGGKYIDHCRSLKCLHVPSK